MGSFINKRELTVKTKMAIFNSIYCPTLMYGSESWTLEARDKSRLQATEMKFLRRTIRKTRIREEVKADSLEERIERKQLRWNGHVNRMNEDRIPKQIFESRSQFKLPRGRPKTIWLDVIKQNVEKRGCTMVEAKRRCSDRSKWRAFVHQ